MAKASLPIGDVENFDRTKYEKMMNTTWSMDNNGDITISMTYPFASNSSKLQGHYDADKEEICIFGTDHKCSSKLYPVQDRAYRTKLKKFLPLVSQSGGRYAFTAETVTDNDTGLVWAREGDLSGKNGRENDFNQIVALIDDLNLRRYGGRNNWRIPTFSEMKTLTESVSGGPPIEAYPNDDNIDIKLNDLGFIAIERDICYWTSDLCHKNQNCTINLTDLKSNCSGRNRNLLPVSGRDFRSAGKTKREE